MELAARQHNPQPRLWLAFIVAILAHLGLLMIPILKPTYEKVAQPIFVRLQTMKPEPAQLPIPESATSPKEEQPKPPALVKETPESSAPTEQPRISYQLLQDFAQREATDSAEENREELDRFASTFVVKQGVKAPKLRAYKSGYGDIHVETQIGNQPVCYLKNNQLVEDDWGFNLTMFYACNEKEPFKLELR